MTPERKKYLVECSKREMFLRKKIADCKMLIKHLKYATYKKLGAPYFHDVLQCLRLTKYEYTAYRHELNRLKGMDRGVVPEFYHSTDVYHCPKCTTAIWFASDKYCPNCGSRILWEKVK